MRRPKWVTTIGVICIVLGIFRMFNAGQLIFLPDLLDNGKRIMERTASDTSAILEDTIAGISYSYRISHDSADQEALQRLNKILGDNLTPSPYFITWSVRMGYIGLVVMLIYISGGVLLLFARPFSIKFIYASLGLALLYYIFFFMILLSDKAASPLAFGEALERFIAIIIDLTLVGYVISGSKEYFYRQNA